MAIIWQKLKPSLKNCKNGQFLRRSYLFYKISENKPQQLKEKTQNSRQKLKVSAKSKTQFAENASKKKPGCKEQMNL